MVPREDRELTVGSGGGDEVFPWPLEIYLAYKVRASGLEESDMDVMGHDLCDYRLGTEAW
jgi:hypothetical protein